MKKFGLFGLVLLLFGVPFLGVFASANGLSNVRESSAAKVAEQVKKVDQMINKASSTSKQDTQDKQMSDSEVGINIDTECMGGVGCSFSVYDTLGIRKDRAPGERTSVMLFLQDIILGASMFIGTVVTVALILSGAYYIFSGADASYKKQAKEGMQYALIGLVIVLLAIVIVRVVQFMARGGS